MEAESQAAEQIVRITLAGSETLVRLTGAGAKQAAAALLAVAASREQSKGKARLGSLLKSGKELSVFTLTQEQLKPFAREAKRYGVLYTVVKDKEKSGPLDLIVRREDAGKINRIIDRLGIGTVRPESLSCEITRPGVPEQEEIQGEAPRKMDMSRDDAEALLADIQGSRRTEEQTLPLDPGPRSESPSGPTSNSGDRSARTGSEGRSQAERTSVRKRIKDIERARSAAPPDAKGVQVPGAQTKTPIRKEGKTR